MIGIVLSIEDDSVTQVLNRIYFEDANFCQRMDEAMNGVEALKYYENLNKNPEAFDKIPEIILLDLNMPVMDGWEFLKAFNQLFPHFAERTNVFIHSSSANPIDKEKAKQPEYRIIEFFPKPLDVDNINVMKEYIAKKRLM